MNKRGFSLIEVIVVIGIMGLLTALIYTSFDANKAKSRDQKRVSDISAIQISLELYFNQNGRYPLVLEDKLNPANGLVPKYISSIPVPPQGSETYEYLPLTRMQGSDICISYQLWTKFERGNSYLDSRKKFNSSVLNGPYYECGSGHNKIDAGSNDLIYDVMPL